MKSDIMEYTMIDNLLQGQGLKRTKLRVALLGYLFNAKHAQSYPDIKRALGENVDRSTLYRNLTAFEEVGIIHRIEQGRLALVVASKYIETGYGYVLQIKGPDLMEFLFLGVTLVIAIVAVLLASTSIFKLNISKTLADE